MRYDAFISYSHASDRDLSRIFQSDLERFGARWPWARARRVYRDETNLAATPDLWGLIEAALDASERLVLLASPASTRSAWVPRELAHFIAARGTAAICVVLTQGTTPFTDRGNLADFDAALADETLAYFGDAAPLVVDLRPFRDRPRRARSSHDYQNAVATVVAFVSGRDKDLIFSEHIARRRRWTWLFATIALAMTGLALVAMQQWFAQRAATAAQLAATERVERVLELTQIQRASSRATASVHDDPERALHTAANAWRAATSASTHPDDDSTTTDAVATRDQAATALATVLRASAGFAGSFDGPSGPTVALGASDDGTVETLGASGDLHRWRVETGLVAAQRSLGPPDRIIYTALAVRDDVAAGATADRLVVLTPQATRRLDVANVTRLAICPHQIVYATDTDVWMLATDKPAEPTRIAIGPSRALACEGGRAYLACERFIAAIDLAKGDTVGPIWLAHRLSVASTIAITADAHGAVALVDSQRQSVTLWSSLDAAPVVLSAPRVSLAAFGRDGELFTLHGDGTLHTWSSAGETRAQREVAGGSAVALAYDARHDRVLTLSADDRVRAWASTPADPLAQFLEDSVFAGGARFEGTGIVALTTAHRLQRWPRTLDTGDHAFDFSLGGEVLASSPNAFVLKHAPDSEDLVVVRRDGRRISLPVHSDDVIFSAAISVDGHRAATDCAGHTACYWDLAGVAPINVPVPVEWPITFDFDSTGMHLIAANARETIVWRVSDQRVVDRIAGPDITAIAANAARDVLVLGGHGTLRWSKFSEPNTTIATPVVSTMPIIAIALHPVRDWAATMDLSGRVALVDLATGAKLLELAVATETRQFHPALAFDDRGERLLVTRTDGVYVIDTNPENWAVLAERIAGPL